MEPNQIKRWVTLALGVLAVLFNKKLGLNLGEVEIAALATMVSVFIGASNAKEFGIAKVEAQAETAAKEIDSREKAMGVLRGPSVAGSSFP